MRLLLTGGTGYIGSVVARDLLGAGHEVLALARSKSSEDKVTALGCRPVSGNMTDAQVWLSTIGGVDGVLHLAATFDTDMAAAEAAFLDALVAWASDRPAPLPLVYTGGCWLYGAVGGTAAVEGSPFDPLPAFAFMVDHRARLLGEEALSVRIVHPAMVWDAGGGTLAAFLSAASQGEPPVVTGSLETRWPMVHRDDLARLFRLAIERGEGGADYHGVGETGVAVGAIAGAIARRAAAPGPVVRSVEDAMAALGDWAAGLGLDQTMDCPGTRQALDWRAEMPGVIEGMTDA
ncbi:MAG: NAD-dependent epimerase/dehydratase family protein [Thalassobaculaceae bacterium]|nr:NAD-dependent epimerase/dehydratase family protein [Thalassobaculaceae bacterium]